MPQQKFNELSIYTGMTKSFHIGQKVCPPPILREFAKGQQLVTLSNGNQLVAIQQLH